MVRACRRSPWSSRATSRALALIGAFSPGACCNRLLERPVRASSACPRSTASRAPFWPSPSPRYPTSSCSLRAAFRAARSRSGRGCPADSAGRRRDLLHRHPAARAARRSPPASLAGRLYAISDFGAVSLMQYDTLTRAIYTQYRSLFHRDSGLGAGTPAGRDHGAWCSSSRPARAARARASTARRRGPGPAGAPVALGRWRRAGPRAGVGACDLASSCS